MARAQRPAASTRAVDVNDDAWRHRLLARAMVGAAQRRGQAPASLATGERRVNGKQPAARHRKRFFNRARAFQLRAGVGAGKSPPPRPARPKTPNPPPSRPAGSPPSPPPPPPPHPPPPSLPP